MRARLRRCAGCIALATSAVTVAGLVLMATAPAQGSTGAPATMAGAPARNAQSAPVTSSPRAKAWAAKAKADAAHYTNAPCNTTPKAGTASCFAVVYTAVKNKIAAAPDDQPPAGALGPADIRSAYDLPLGSAGSGQTVAIVDSFGDSTAESDLATFRSFYGLPACTTANGCFRKVAQDGSTSYPAELSAGWDLETALDLDAVSSACPRCHILLLEADDNFTQNLGTAENEAVALGAKFVSNSWGSTEDPVDTDFDAAFFNHPGVVIDAATGDVGNVTEFPSTSPHVAGIGGTTLTRDSTSPRGWDETAWADGGSGCSNVAAQPGYQQNIASVASACPANKAVADISADADPDSGLATFDTTNGGWLQVGGTSLATPLVTAMYALAGLPPAPGTYPVSYPYADPHQSADLNDITSGSNGSCNNDLCNAGPGWDGPTGLGSPHGVAALGAGPTGVMSGRVTSHGRPVAGATVSAAGTINDTATTDSAGDYKLTLPAGSYALTVTAFGYQPATATSITVTTDQFAKKDFKLTAIPERQLSGTITDGSGAGWPLYAKISISGDPRGAIYTNPFTGTYTVNLPQNATYSLHVAPLYPGYTADNLSVRLGATAAVRSDAVTVDPTTCNAPGYTVVQKGLSETFDGPGWGVGPFLNGTADGWTNVDNIGTGDVWQFFSVNHNPPPPGGDKHFANVNDSFYGNPDDTSLVSPVVSLAGQTAPEIAFGTTYSPDQFTHAAVDLSLDGGQTWSTVWTGPQGFVSAPVQIPVPQAAGNPDVQVRFHYVGIGLGGAPAPVWEVDNVEVGTRLCQPGNIGLVAGTVRDGNTGTPVDGAQVASASNSGQSGLTEPSADPAFPDGFYWLAATAGSTQFAASDNGYATAKATVGVKAGSVTERNYVLAAGRLGLSSGSLSVTERPGATKTSQLTFRNNGTQPVTVSLGTQDGGFRTAASPARAGNAPLQIPARLAAAAGSILAKSAGSAARPAAAQPQDTPPATEWAPVSLYPDQIIDNVVGTDPGTGKVYSFGGFGGKPTSDTFSILADGFVYDPSTQQWSQVASIPQPVERAAGAFLDGKVYLAGGWDANGNPLSSVYAYDPLSDTWSQVASLPAPVSAAAAAVLGGQLYVVGGCVTAECDPSVSTVFRYGPAANKWTQLTSFPLPVAFAACAGVSTEVVCAGGIDTVSNEESDSTYIYNPHANTWSQGADMPYFNYDMSYADSGNQLQVANGVATFASPSGTVITVVTDMAAQYDPSTDTWSSLPTTVEPGFRGGGSCGFYQIGMADSLGVPLQDSQLLAGFSDCGHTAVPWLSVSQTQFTVQPGQSVTVTVTAHPAAATKPGSYTGYLSVSTDSPYPIRPVTVTLKVT